ncbi:hypothetical protein [Propioniciclava soli]|uniref:EcsC family protein n=1 Tax=Propioniciclava soli TaxID=2775081 RepID=A0ABZ3CBR8_9ACTN|nr:hypothetical protein [Propioniciclava soli]
MSNATVIQTVAFATREFNRLYDALVRSDEPVPDDADLAEDGDQVTDTAGEAADDATTNGDDAAKKGGLLRGAVGAAVGTVVGAARLGLGAARFGARLVTGRTHPAARGWSKLSADKRIAWWRTRLSIAAASAAAVPSATGRIGSALGVVDAIGAAGQIIMACAVGKELGASEREQIRVAAQVALGAEATPEEIDAVLAGDIDADAADGGEGAEREEAARRGVVGRIGATAGLVRDVAGRLYRLRSSLGERQRGGLFARALSNLPVVGAAGGFLAERSGVHRAARAAREAYERA